jgi:hypothetical protein
MTAAPRTGAHEGRSPFQLAADDAVSTGHQMRISRLVLFLFLLILYNSPSFTKHLLSLKQIHTKNIYLLSL